MAQESGIESALRRLADLSEADFTRDVVIPLFESLNYERVEYYGGTDEEGKDIVCWRINELGETELTVGQIKKYKPSRRAADKRSFSEVVNQLFQASEKKLPYSDGIPILPEIIYFITPYRIDTKVLKSRLEAYQTLKARRVRILDGPRLARLLEEKRPDLFSDLLTTRQKLQISISPQLTNETLLKALQLPQRRTVESFYTDVDFAVGNPRTRLFFGHELSPTSVHSYFEENDWIELEALNKRCKELLGKNFFEMTQKAREEMLGKFRKTRDLTVKWAIGHREAISQYLATEKAINKPTPENDAPESFRDVIREYKEVLAEEMAILTKLSEGRETEQELLDWQLRHDEAESKFLAAEGEAESRNRNKKEEDRKRLKELYLAVQESSRARPKSQHPIVIEGQGVASSLLEMRAEILATVELFNTSCPTSTVLADFMNKCGNLVSLVQDILSNPRAALALGFNKDSRISVNESRTRLKMSVHHLFQTGINITVLGEAGAGKTTSLQMYAHRLMTAENNERLVIFAPLIKLMNEWRTYLPDEWHDPNPPPLQEGLQLYLRSMGLSINAEDLVKELRRTAGIILLDGIDEVFRSSPWIVETIENFSELLPKLQIVISSRMSGDYVERLPFFSVTILPFTAQQRDNFFERWFDEDQPRTDRIFSHIEKTPQVADVVKNPLSATILCVLAQNDVRLPNNEVRLYAERLKLLLGYYDIHKQVTRIESRFEDLAKLARKIAFQLHLKGIRYASIETLRSWSEVILRRDREPARSKQSLDELIDPCNVLIPMAEDGRVGFGHLRYQEHLAAEEISRNRSVDLAPLMAQDWWRGALILYAQLDPDLGDLVSDLANSNRLAPVADIALEMIDLLPESRADELRRVVDRSVTMDSSLLSLARSLDDDRAVASILKIAKWVRGMNDERL